MTDLYEGTGQARLGRVRLCYLQFDYARPRNSVKGKPLCYIGKLELSEHH